MKRFILPIAIFCILVMLVLPVTAGGDFVNKYVDNNPKYSVLPMSDYGNVEFFIRACGSGQDLNVWVAPVKANLTFDPTWYPDGMEIKDQNKDFKLVKVLPDCLSASEQYAAGEYVAYLKQGNGDQTEVQRFKVGGGGTTRVTFLGAAVSSPGIYECFHKFKILKATYGNGECYYITVIDEKPWTEYIYHPEQNHTITVIDREGIPGWTEEIYHPEVNHTIIVVDVPEVPAWDEYVYHPEVNHTERQISTWQIVTPATPATGVPAEWGCVEWKWGWCTDWDYEPGHVHAKEAGSSSVDFYYGTTPMHITGNWHDTAYMVTPGTPAEWGWIVTTPWEDGTCGGDRIVPTTDCEERIVVDSQEWVEVIHHDAIPAITHEEIVVDKEAWTEYIEHDAIPPVTHEEIVIDSQEWIEVIEHEAVTHDEQICNNILDVTAELQSVVASGHLQFYFDNTVNPGGIFSEGGELLVELPDPAPQYPKTVFITYEDRCGNSPRVEIRSLTGSEQTVFSLGEETTVLSSTMCEA